MRVSLYSFKFMIGGALFALILLVYLFAIHVTNLYRDKTTESQMDSLSILVASKTNDLIDRKVNQQRQFGIQLSNQPTFKSAVAQNDFTGITTWLSQYFIEQKNARSSSLISYILEDVPGILALPTTRL